MNFSKCFFTAVFSGAVLSSAMAEDKPVVVGMSAPILNNKAAPYGEQMLVTAEAFIAEINAQGGLLGRELILNIQDDECKAEKAGLVFNRLVASGDPDIVIGPLCSDVTKPQRDLWKETGALVLTLSQAPVTGPEYPKLLRNISSNGAIVKGMMAEVKKIGSQKVALFHDTAAYGQNILDILSVAAKDQNLALIPVAVDPKDNDFTVRIARMKEDEVTTFLIGTNDAALASLIARQTREALPAVEIILPGAGTNEIIGHNYFCTDVTDKGLRVIAGEDGANYVKNEFEKAVEGRMLAEKKYGLRDTAFFTMASLQAWSEAVKQAQSFDPDKILKVLTTENVKTVMGDISFRTDGAFYGHLKSEPVGTYAWKCKGNKHPDFEHQ